MRHVVRGPSKTCRTGTPAPKRITLVGPPGTVGRLGRNGAGRSTSMRILATPPAPEESTAHLTSPDVASLDAGGAPA